MCVFMGACTNVVRHMWRSEANDCVYLCVCVHGSVHKCYEPHVEVRGQLLGICFLLPLCGLFVGPTQVVRLGHQCLSTHRAISLAPIFQGFKMVSCALCHLMFTEVLHDVRAGVAKFRRPYHLSDTIDLVLGLCFIARQFFPVVGHGCEVSVWRGVIVRD